MASSKSEIPHETTLREENFHHYAVDMRFSRKEITFVMVDLWHTGFGPEPLSDLGWETEYNAGKSFCDRAGSIEMDRILPMLKACRQSESPRPKGGASNCQDQIDQAAEDLLSPHDDIGYTS